MFRNKRKNVEKGYIILYTLLVCSVLVIMSLLIFTMEIRRMANVQSYKRYVQRNIKQQDYREYLLTYMYMDLTTNVNNMNTVAIRNYLSGKKSSFKSEDLKATIKYDISNSKLNLDTPYDPNYFRRDLYDFKVTSGKLIFVFLKSLYIEGKVE